MAVTADVLLRDLHTQLARRARQRVLPQIGSRALRNALRTIVTAKLARLYVPHYWAVYYHDGTGPFGPRRARVLVWFRDPADDPRLKPGPPIREKDIRRLTKKQFYEGLARNAISPGYMIVARRHRGHAPHPFFERGMQGFRQSVAPFIRTKFRTWLLTQVPLARKSRARARL